MDPKDIPSSQRALVLQGGGTRGAYELGVLKVLCKKIAKESKINDSKGCLCLMLLLVHR